MTGLLLLLVGSGLLFARWRWGAQFELSALVSRLRELGADPGAVPFFLLIYLVGTSLLLPAVGFAMVAAVVWGYWPGLAVSMVALNVAANFQFSIGRWLGRSRIAALVEKRGWSAAAMRATGVSTMIAVRQLPLPFVAVNLAAGASPLRRWQFAVGSAVGGVPPALIFTSFATAVIDGVEGARTEALLKALAGGSVVLALALAPKLWAWWRSRG